MRVEAAKALRASHTEEALTALLASAAQPDARVRRQVVDDIGGFYDAKARDFARKVVREEKNPDIIITALRDLGGYADPEISEELLKSLKTESFRNEIAGAAIGAMRLQDDPVFVTPLMETLSKDQEAFTSHGFAQGLSALAYLARNEENKDRVREFLSGQLDSRKRVVQLAAINALGTFATPRQ